MVYKGKVRGGVVELEDDVELPEGSRVRVIPEERADEDADDEDFDLGKWLESAHELRATLPKTSDSTEILRQIRLDRASR
jgi:hypothetical protein